MAKKLKRKQKINKFVFTLKGFEVLKELIRKTEKRLAAATKVKAEAASGQDVWHEEEFKLGITEEMMWSKRLEELQNLISNAQIVEIEEQNNLVKLGTGVIIEYEDGSIEKFILEGYMAEPMPKRVSIYSPLGKRLLGAKKGEERVLRLEKTKRIVKVKEILSPSKAEALFP